jgi:adenine-specific DNA-methyltransferase
MDQFTILNYQGSKKNLIDFIHSNTDLYIDKSKAILDIFSGTCSIGYSFKSRNVVYANDSELYSYHISKALLGKRPQRPEHEVKDILDTYINKNFQKLNIELGNFNLIEKRALNEGSVENLCEIYTDYPTIWSGKHKKINEQIYHLFSTYYAGTYFGIEQAFYIDSIRYAIDYFANTELFSIMIASLFYAIKESVFAKDGHMAQPLDPLKNSKKLLQQRIKKIDELFWNKVLEFYSSKFIDTNNLNRVYNLDFRDLLKKEEIRENVGFIYADPPYTDMQYSRYYHLLNVLAKYDYPKPSTIHGKYTKGLYTENRFQSVLSQKGSSLKNFRTLIEYSKLNKINIAISFAYPANPSQQKTDRYVMTIDEIIKVCSEICSAKNVDVTSIEYTHSNNRNSEAKKVREYLVLSKNR